MATEGWLVKVGSNQATRESGQGVGTQEVLAQAWHPIPLSQWHFVSLTMAPQEVTRACTSVPITRCPGQGQCPGIIHDFWSCIGCQDRWLWPIRARRWPSSLVACSTLPTIISVMAFLPKPTPLFTVTPTHQGTCKRQISLACAFCSSLALPNWGLGMKAPCPLWLDYIDLLWTPAATTRWRHQSQTHFWPLNKARISGANLMSKLPLVASLCSMSISLNTWKFSLLTVNFVY